MFLGLSVISYELFILFFGMAFHVIKFGDDKRVQARKSGYHRFMHVISLVFTAAGVLVLLTGVAGLLTGCGNADKNASDQKPSLKEAYADYFEIGVCINPTVVSADNYSEAVLREFSSVTCENNLKPESIISYSLTVENLDETQDHLVLNFDNAASELAFAEENGLKMRGHTLVWYSQTPDWIFYKDYDVNGELADRDLMLSRLEHYIEDVFDWAKAEHPGLFYAWDVVNEAMGDDGKMRDCLWRQTIGDDYVEQAFAMARKYAPDEIALFYNDYNAFHKSKQAAIIEMLQPVVAAGNLDGVGMQGHLSTNERGEHFAKAAAEYANALGVIIHITEIDVSEPAYDPEHFQGMYYGELFKALANAKKNGVPIESVSIWGLTDGLSWKAEEHPLIFHSDVTPKEAYYKILDAIAE